MKKILLGVASLISAISYSMMEIPMDGLEFNLDSSNRKTLLCDESGFITNWVCQRTGLVFKNTDNFRPYLDESDFGGRGAVLFGFVPGSEYRERTALYCDTEINHKSIFIVYHFRGYPTDPLESPNMAELYGKKGYDHGIRTDYYCRGYALGDSLSIGKDIYYNGVKTSGGTTQYIPNGVKDVAKDTYVYAAVALESGSVETFIPQIGGYSSHSSRAGDAKRKRMFAGGIAEIIVYSRTLSDSEVASLQNKLMNKWKGTALFPENVWMKVESSISEINVSTVPACGEYVKGEESKIFSIVNALSTHSTGDRVVTSETTDSRITVYKGYEVLSQDGTVLQSSDTDEEFEFISDEPFTVRWKLEHKYSLQLSEGENGNVVYNDEDVSSSASYWGYNNDSIHIKAVPSEGFHFAYWTGDVCGIDIYNPSLIIKLDEKRALKAVFKEGEAEYPRIFSRGLVFKLDAKDLETVMYNENNEVTNWFSRVNNVCFDEHVTGKPPYYNQSAFNSRGGVRFGRKLGADDAEYVNMKLKASKYIPIVRTIGVVLNPANHYDSSMCYILGYPSRGFVCHYMHRLYAQSFIAHGWVWMDDGLMRGHPKKFTISTDTLAFHDLKHKGTNDDTHVIIAEDAAEDASVATKYFSLGNYETNPMHASYVKRTFPGDIGEAIGYDFSLSPAEVRYVMAYQNKKWRGVPFEMARVTESTTISEDSTYANLLVDGKYTLTIAPGVTLSITNLLVISDDVTFDIKEGATLRIPEIVKYDAASKAYFKLNNSNLVLQEEGRGYGKLLEDQSYNKIGSPLLHGEDNEVYKPMFLPGDVTGTGTIYNEGARPLKLQSTDVYPDALTWKLNASLDLNGCSLTAAGILGKGRIINSNKDVVPTLTITSDSPYTFENRICDNINFVKSGSGDTTLAGGSDTTGAIIVDSGEAKISQGVWNPKAISNLVCHLDASRRDSLEIDENGQVVCWKSIVGDGAKFIHRSNSTYFFAPPLYSSNICDGKPGLCFSMDTEGNKTSITNSLFGDRAYHCRTIIAVVKPHATPCSAGNYWGYVWADSHFDSDVYSPGLVFYNDYSNTKKWVYQQGVDKTSKIYINSKVVYDRERGIEESRFSDTSLQVYAFSTINTPNNYTPAIGSLRTHVRSYRGAVAEILCYSHDLTKEEMHRVSTALMAKWGIEANEGSELDSSNYLPPSSTIELGSSATLDLGGTANNIESFVGGGSVINGRMTAKNARIESDLLADDFSASALTYALVNGTYPCITTAGMWDLSKTDLTLEDYDSYTGKSYTTLIRSTQGGLTGSLNSAPDKVKSTSRRVAIGIDSTLILLR